MSSFTKPHVPLRSNLPTETSYIPTAQLYFQFLELNHNLKRVEGFKPEKMDQIISSKFRKISEISYKFGFYQILSQFDEFTAQLYFQFLELNHNLERVSNVDKIFGPISKSVLNSVHNKNSIKAKYFKNRS